MRQVGLGSTATATQLMAMAGRPLDLFAATRAGRGVYPCKVQAGELSLRGV